MTASAATLLATLPPTEALRAWMDDYAEFVAAKRGMLDTLRAGWASGRITTPTTRARVTAAIASLLDAGVESGDFRPGVEADDVTAMILGVFLAARVDQQPAQTDRLLDFVVDGLRREV